MAANKSPSHHTLGALARRYGVKVWQVRRLFERNLLPEPGRIGHYRVVPDSDLPKIEAALRRAGYIPEGPTNAA